MRTRITPNTDTYHVVYQISLQQPHYSQNIKSILAMLYCGIGARDIFVACVRFTPLTSDLKLQIISDKDVDVLFEVSVTHLWQKWYVKCLLIRIEYLFHISCGFSWNLYPNSAWKLNDPCKKEVYVESSKKFCTDISFHENDFSCTWREWIPDLALCTA